jgi:transposase-like protein
MPERGIYNGTREDLMCPHCDHTPVWEEDPANEAPTKYYCHACNRGFDMPKGISDSTKD